MSWILIKFEPLRLILVDFLVNITGCTPILTLPAYAQWVILSVIVCVLMHLMNYFARCICYPRYTENHIFFCHVWNINMKPHIIFADIVGFLIGPVGFALLSIGFIFSILSFIWALFGKEFIF